MDGKKMTADEFKAIVNEILEDANDPNSELYGILADGEQMIKETSAFDVGFSQRMGALIGSIRDLADYVKARAEKNN